MPCDWAKNSAVMPIISAPLLVRVKSLGFRSMPASIGMWCMCSRPPTICTSSASATIACDAWASACKLLPHKPIDRRAARLDGHACHQPDRPGDIQPLLALLLRVAEHDVFDHRRVDARPLHERAHHRDGEVVGADIAKDTLLRMRPPNRRPTTINNNSSLHKNLDRITGSAGSQDISNS